MVAFEEESENDEMIRLWVLQDKIKSSLTYSNSAALRLNTDDVESCAVLRYSAMRGTVFSSSFIAVLTCMVNVSNSYNYN